jgi:hypothetical protein
LKKEGVVSYVCPWLETRGKPREQIIRSEKLPAVALGNARAEAHPIFTLISVQLAFASAWSASTGVPENIYQLLLIPAARRIILSPEVKQFSAGTVFDKY